MDAARQVVESAQAIETVQRFFDITWARPWIWGREKIDTDIPETNQWSSDASLIILLSPFAIQSIF
jgi:hypothetical protein